MLYPNSIILPLLLFAESVSGAMLKGLIQADDSNGQPMPNVQVSAVAGTAPTATDDDGKFALSFPMKQAGEIVQLIVRKPGYVPVNGFQLRLALPRDADAEPLRLFLCKPEDRDEMASRFYHFSTLAAEKTGTELQRKLDAERSRDVQLYIGIMHARTQAAQSASTNPEIHALADRLRDLTQLLDSHDSLRHLSASDYMKLQVAKATLANAERDYGKTLRLFSAEDARALLKTAEERRDKEQLDVAVRAYRVRGDAYYGLDQWREAIEAYIVVLKRRPNDLATETLLANCLLEMERFDESVPLFTTVISTFALLETNKRTVVEIHLLANALSGRSWVLSKKGEREKALNDITRAIDIYKDLVQKELKPAFTPSLAAAYEQRANLNVVLGHLRDADTIADLNTAVGIMKDFLANGSNAPYLDRLWYALNIRSAVLYFLGQFKKSMEDLQEAVPLGEQLVTRDKRMDLAQDLEAARRQLMLTRLLLLVPGPKESIIQLLAPGMLSNTWILHNQIKEPE